MKTPGFLAASMAATTVLTGIKSSHPDPLTSGRGTSADKTSCSPPEKFAPRFDGLRFIETLVTAHR
ncbi:hypothetical protein Hanom_Chr16g01461001 [Helianthus anomalus]